LAGTEHVQLSLSLSWKQANTVTVLDVTRFEPI
jgi:hypothetical protein